jgi:hypothetical protein
MPDPSVHATAPSVNLINVPLVSFDATLRELDPRPATPLIAAATQSCADAEVTDAELLAFIDCIRDAGAIFLDGGVPLEALIEDFSDFVQEHLASELTREEVWAFEVGVLFGARLASTNPTALAKLAENPILSNKLGHFIDDWGKAHA